MPMQFLPISPRVAITTVFISFGVAVGSLAGSMPTLMRNAGIDSETVGLGLTISTLMTVTAMALGGTIARYASNRAMLLGILPVFALLLLAYLTSQSELWFYLAIIPMGFAFGLTDLFMNSEAAAIEHDLKRPVFTAFHGAVSSAVAVIALASSFISTEIGTWATGLLTVGVFAAAWLMVRIAIKPRQLVGGRSARLSTLPNKLPLVLLGLAAGLIIAAETAALLWSAKLLDEQAPQLAAIAGLGAAFYALCNAVVRFPGDSLRARFGDVPLMIGSLIVAMAGFASLGFTASFAASVTAFAMVGLGTAVLIPCAFAMAAGYVPANRAAALSFVSLLTIAPRTLAPWAVGLVASGFGIGIAFGLMAVALAVALVLILSLGRIRRA
jgi:hypothetical protein